MTTRCPNCSEEIEAPESRIDAGFECPECLEPIGTSEAESLESSAADSASLELSEHRRNATEED